MPRGCSRHLSTRRRAVSGPDLRRRPPYVYPAETATATRGDLPSSFTSGQAILNRIRLRSLIKGAAFRTFLFAISLAPTGSNVRITGMTFFADRLKD